MQFLKDVPLKRKITWVAMMTALSTLVIALVALSVIESRQFRRVFEKEVQSIGAITGGNSVAALEFLDVDAARRTLSVLAQDPRILAAVLYDAGNREFARFVAPSAKPDVDILNEGIRIREPIMASGKQVGSILIVASDREILDRILSYAFIMCLIAAFAAAAAYLLSERLQSIVSEPILGLASMAGRVSRTGDYSLRAVVTSKDETGELIRQFNAMLETIEHASQALRASESQLRTITDSLPVLISYVDAEGRFRFNNAAYAKWFTEPPGGFTGKLVSDVLGEKAFAVVRSFHERALAGETVQCEAEVEYEALGRRYISCSLIPDVDARGKVQGVFSLVMDVTERQEAEAERERLLASETAARNDAERASRLKDEFLATLSHELRTPLNAIVGWSQILLRGDLQSSDQLREGVEVISRNARAQAKLIADLLDLSRITSEKLVLDVEPIDLKLVIESAIDAVGVSAQSKKLRINRDLQSGVVVSGDSARLEQVVWNLLSNSIKFTPAGGTINVTLKRRDDRTAEIRVIDSGQGIGAEFLPYVFERFRQADSSTTRRFGGLGIGLALVRQLVELHGGSVRAESPGQDAGATFIVELPACDHIAEALPRIADPRPIFRGLRVLVIDDEPDTVSMLRRLLEESHAVVLSADSAALGFKILRAERPHIVLSDIGMPEHNGYDFISWVRRLNDKEGGSTPAVALTALARPEDKVQALAAGFQAHLAKPIEDRELYSTITRLVPAQEYRNQPV